MSDRGLHYLQRARVCLGGLVFAGGFALMGCHGSVVTLGEKPPPAYHCDAPRLVTELASSSGRSNNATLTEDLLEIYFSSTRDQDGRDSGEFDVWSASRSTRYEAFGPPQRLRINTSRRETGSAISADGLTLWIASDRRVNGMSSNNLDIWVTTRPSRSADWGDPVIVPALNSPQFDIPRPPGSNGLTMPLGSERGPGSIYRSFFATRPSIGAPFETPQSIPDFTFENATTMDMFLSMDSLTIFYASEPAVENDTTVPAAVDASLVDSGIINDAGDGGSTRASADLFVAERTRDADAFTRRRAIDELNTSFQERDPWMSEDKTQFFFSSDRGGNMNIYTCDVIFKQ